MGDGKDFIREVVKKFEKLEKAYENGKIKNVRGDFLPKNTNFPKEIIPYKFDENKLYIRRQA